MFIIREYIKYCSKAKRRHGIHSPFVYKFSDECLSIKIPNYTKHEFSALKRNFLHHKESITIQDFGAGSKKHGDQRTVKQIARSSTSKTKDGRLLYQLATFYQPSRILELGTSLGLGTYMLAAAHKNTQITTVEGCPAIHQLAKENFPSTLQHKVNFINQPFFEFLKNLKDEDIFDLVFIDGDHRGEQLLQQLELLSSHIHDETIIVLDDIRWTKDMLSSWEEIIKNSAYHLTIDLFEKGIIVLRRHQEKEHFAIRW
jgi:predicted O-methyltransferase YrrM